MNQKYANSLCLSTFRVDNIYIFINVLFLCYFYLTFYTITSELQLHIQVYAMTNLNLLNQWVENIDVKRKLFKKYSLMQFLQFITPLHKMIDKTKKIVLLKK